MTEIADNNSQITADSSINDNLHELFPRRPDLAALRGMRILLVDDLPTNIILAQAILDRRLLATENVAENSSSGSRFRIAQEPAQIVQEASIMVFVQGCRERGRSVGFRRVPRQGDHRLPVEADPEPTNRARVAVPSGTRPGRDVGPPGGAPRASRRTLPAPLREDPGQCGAAGSARARSGSGAQT